MTNQPALDYDGLSNAPRLLMEARLKPLQGDRFQPTGFSNLGPARYTTPEGVEMLIVESTQSVANRMEMACWNPVDDDLIEALRGLPYIRVKNPDGTSLTNSVLESHRINSEYIAGDKNGSFVGRFCEEAGYTKGKPINWSKFHRALLKYDVGSLLHGSFLEEIDGRLRVTRLLSGFIEAKHVRVAESGGVKASRVDPTVKGGGGSVPFSRTEFTAREMKASFNLDLALLRGYGLGENATHLLIALALFKVQRFLSSGLRLRTACDLELEGDLIVTRPTGFAVPPENALLKECSGLVAKCKPLFADPSVTEVARHPAKAKAKGKDRKREALDDGRDEAQTGDEDE